MCSNNEEKKLGPKVGLNVGDKRKSFEKVKSCQVKFLKGILTILIETFHFVRQHFFFFFPSRVSRYFALFPHCCEKRGTPFHFFPPPLLYFTRTRADSCFLENMGKKIWKFLNGQNTNIVHILFCYTKGK